MTGRRRIPGEPGRLKWRMVELLERAMPGWKISPYDLWEQKGWYRAHGIHIGGASWGGHGTDAAGRDVQFSAWDTMTLCAKFDLLVGDEGDGTWAVSANRPVGQ